MSILSSKLNLFYELSFEHFLKEIKKTSDKKISLKEQEEWEDYFEGRKKELLELKEKIDGADGEINRMIYEVYNITEKEKKIIEESLK